VVNHKRCGLYQGKFQWRKYPWLKGVIEDSGITSTGETTEFYDLLEEVNSMQEEHRAPRASSKQLKVS
jgi:hypothetical protein